MKVTTTLLSIPPFISTTWENVRSIHLKKENQSIVITLNNDTEVEIENLSSEETRLVFQAHARFLQIQSIQTPPQTNTLEFALPLKPNSLFDSPISSAQHNPEQSNLPPIPKEILNKLKSVAKALGIDDTSVIPKTEPGCNCMYCQVQRAIFDIEENEEEVLSEELTFRNWDVEEIENNLFKVTNRLDQNETYQVYLNKPIGCTCGSKNCEHIQIALSS